MAARARPPGRTGPSASSAAPTGPTAPPTAPDPARRPKGRPDHRDGDLNLTGDANPYSGGDPYADYRSADLPFTHLANLADRRLGAGVVAANDEFFGQRENLLVPERAEFDPEHFGAKGRIMDGWETRRRRGARPTTPWPAEDDHDWALVRLGAPGVIRGIVVDTAHFRGNYPQAVSVEATSVPGSPSPEDLLAEDVKWTTLVRTAVGGHAANGFTVDAEQRFTHLRVNQHPDGGIARLRVHGEVVPDPAWLAALGTFDVVALENGGQVEDASNLFYSPATNTIQPGRSRKMDDGWETRRRRDRGHDWIRYRLADRSAIRAIEIDTAYLKGNSAGWASVSVRDGEDGDWREVLPRTRLQPDTNHRFVLPEQAVGTHARVDIPRRRHLPAASLRLPDRGRAGPPVRPPPGAGRLSRPGAPVRADRRTRGHRHRHRHRQRATVTAVSAAIVTAVAEPFLPLGSFTSCDTSARDRRQRHADGGRQPAPRPDRVLRGREVPVQDVERHHGDPAVRPLRRRTAAPGGAGGAGSAGMGGLLRQAMGTAMQVGQRALAGESLAFQYFTSQGGEGTVGFAGVLPGEMRALELDGTRAWFAEKDAFVAAESTVDFSIAFQGGRTGMSGGEGFVLEKFTGHGTVIIAGAGNFIDLDPADFGGRIEVDTGCVVAFEEGIRYGVQRVGGLNRQGLMNAVFGGEGLSLATLEGSGRVILQSLTIESLANALKKAQGGDKQGPTGGLFSTRTG
ncbi:allantoicase [Streptomyces fumanus]